MLWVPLPRHSSLPPLLASTEFVFLHICADPNQPQLFPPGHLQPVPICTRVSSNSPPPSSHMAEHLLGSPSCDAQSVCSLRLSALEVRDYMSLGSYCLVQRCFQFILLATTVNINGTPLRIRHSVKHVTYIASSEIQGRFSYSFLPRRKPRPQKLGN